VIGTLALAAGLAGSLAAPPAAAVPAFSVSTLARQVLPERVVALAWVDDARLLLLTADEVLLYRSAEPGASVLARIALPEPKRAARTPAGLVLVDAEASAAWVLSNRRTRAALVEWSGDRLSLRAEAEALPIQGSATGLRYREGTDWLEGELPSLGAGPFWGVAAAGELAVKSDGHLLFPPAAIERSVPLPRPSVPVGPALAPLWPGWIVATTTHPPGERDAVLLVRPGRRLRVDTAAETDEPIRALASRAVGSLFRLAAAGEDVDGRTHLLLLDVRRSEK
jgi:hypothetical protein